MTLVINYNGWEKVCLNRLNCGNLDNNFYIFDVYDGDIKIIGETHIHFENNEESYLSYYLERAEKSLM